MTFGLLSASYALATQVGYGDNNWLTKLVGKGWAIIITGVCLGLASWPILGFFAILQAILSGGAWLILHALDDSDIIKEPLLGYLRGAIATICLIK